MRREETLKFCVYVSNRELCADVKCEDCLLWSENTLIDYFNTKRLVSVVDEMEDIKE